MLVSRHRPLTTSCSARAARPKVRALNVRAQCCSTLRGLLDDAASAGLGKVRFIVLGDGAILESVNNFGSVRYNEVPNRGVLATIASQDKSFECHITLSKVKEVRFAKSKAKSGEYDIYATRFLGPDGKVLMSCLLHGSQGVYDPAAVEAWTSLANKYGESVTF
ncbi:hypothetical protein PLESTB_000691500 [Pleodorina starrii]|uniref:Uncharacterized protein n=1 Tax=Pleodorina starrii TaxID=330485 RepID=A0A9W6F232_9CHLO|nr:hypothetical protein PLESTM_001225800 [Pleodorina starrii]GLC52950.1 hypothetical protein PLESTB_000691500 [Pleodorina starrii]GLC65246.1 hypothetical protein PLESTF_000267800 [Pleodorina starrii]